MRMLIFSSAILLLGLFSLTACDDPITVTDAGILPSDGGGPTGVLVLESESALMLNFGEEAAVIVRYEEDGRPVEGREIRFALEGRAHDSTVQALSRSTDDRGRIHTDIIAGSEPAVFRLRVSADASAPVYVDVAVSNEGFGALIVNAPYRGIREGIATRNISVFAETTCAEIQERLRVPDRVWELAEGEDATTFGGLVAGLDYTALASIEGSTGVLLASACRDALPVRDQEQTRVDLRFEDAPLRVPGTYSGEVSISTEESASELALRASEGTIVLLDDAGGDAEYLLQALLSELREREENAAADALLGAWEAAVDNVGGRLLADDAGPSPALEALIGILELRLSSLTFSGILTLSTLESTPEVSFELASLRLGGDDVHAPRVITMEAAPIGATPRWDVLEGERDDLLSLVHAQFSAPLGSLGEAVLTTEAQVSGLSGPAELLRATGGCEQLSAFVDGESELGAACDETCRATACGRALSDLTTALSEALLELDASHAQITLAGPLTLGATGGDLVVNELLSDSLIGHYFSELASEPTELDDVVEAQLDAMRVDLDGG